MGRTFNVHAGTILLLDTCNKYPFTIPLNGQKYKSNEYPELYEIFKDYGVDA